MTSLIRESIDAHSQVLVIGPITAKTIRIKMPGGNTLVQLIEVRFVRSTIVESRSALAGLPAFTAG